MKVNETRVHPQWTGDPWKGFDLAVLFLDAPVDPETLLPIRLAFGTDLTEGLSLNVLGFGGLSSDSAHSPVLQIGTLLYVSHESCKGFHGGRFIAGDKVCAGLTTTKLCHGDLGALLIIGKSHKNEALVGLASIIQQDCGSVTSPSIFSGVTPHLEFLYKAITEAESL